MKLEDALKTTKFKNELHKATLNILYTSYWLRTNISSVMKAHGITQEQYNVMRILKGKHPEAMCVKDIASRMLEKNSNVPRIIDRLVIKKLAKRYNSKEDKRETLINLTEKGLQQLDLITKDVDKTSNTIAQLTEEESQQLNSLLEKLRKVDY